MSKFNITPDMFDFSDTSDLPEDLQSKFNEDSQEKVQAVAAILKAAGRPLSINMVMAVWARMGLEMVTQTTIRTYLTKAVESNLIHKPSRQYYAYGPAVPGEEAAAVEPEAAPADEPDTDADPLAGLDLE